MNFMQLTREESTAVRANLLNAIGREIRKTVTIHPEFLKQFGRCYYLVQIKNINHIEVTILSAEAPLDQAKRQTLQNKALYANKSFFGRLKYEDGKVRWHRERSVKDVVTYAEGKILASFKLTHLADHFDSHDVSMAFTYYMGKKGRVR